MRPLRVGSVPYAVGRPMDLGLEAEPGIEYVREVPARLVEGLRSGRLDVALVSSIELFRRPGYRYLDGIAVAGEGRVSSVQVFLRRPIEEVEGIALDPASRTAAALVRLLLAGRPGGPPRWIEPEPGTDPRAAPADAWLRIGDRALAESLAPDAPPVFNPSAEWARRTGQPFVFAPWIVRPGAPIEPRLGAFVRARSRGAAAIESIAAAAARESELPLAACREYFLRECLFDPGPRLAPALERYRAEASEHGLCPPEHRPTAIPLPPLHAETR